MPSLASSSVAVLQPDPETDWRYWHRFIDQTSGSLHRAFGKVDILNSWEGLQGGNAADYDVVLAVAPARETEPPSGITRAAWIPGIGEEFHEGHPWVSSDLILLPLGARRPHRDLPVTHLGCGVSVHDSCDSNEAVLLRSESSVRASFGAMEEPGFSEIPCSDRAARLQAFRRAAVAVIWSTEGLRGLPLILEAASLGAVSIIPDDEPVLSYFCERSGLGIPCSTEEVALRTARFLLSQPAKLTVLRQAAQRYLRRNHSWSKVSRRLVAALDSLINPVPEVHAIVLNWNGKELLPDCLESLREQEYPRMVPVVVDNGSTDDSCTFVEQVFPECRLVRNMKNLGFASGNNKGMELAIRSGASYVALLNNDTRVCRGWIRELVRAAEQESELGAVGSRMLFYDNPRVINSAGGMMNRSFYGWDRGVFEHDGPQWREPRYCLFVTGGSVLFRAQALRDVGLFDPGYFAYYEDNDLCHRLRLRGWRIGYQPTSRVFHKHSATSGPVSDWKTFLLERSRYRFILKNAPFSYLGRFGRELLAQEQGELRLWWRAREYRREIIQIRAALAALFWLPEIIAWRLFRSSGRDTGWVRELEPNYQRPQFSTTTEELTDVYRGLEPEGRAVVSCMPWFLTGGWSSVVNQFPKYRILQGTGAVRLQTGPIKRGIVQLHLFLPAETSRAEVTVGIAACRFRETVNIPHPGWHTASVEVVGVPSNPVVELTSSHAVGLNEVSLLPFDDCLVRRA